MAARISCRPYQRADRGPPPVPRSNVPLSPGRRSEIPSCTSRSVVPGPADGRRRRVSSSLPSFSSFPGHPPSLPPLAAAPMGRRCLDRPLLGQHPRQDCRWHLRQSGNLTPPCAFALDANVPVPGHEHVHVGAPTHQQAAQGCRGGHRIQGRRPDRQGARVRGHR